MATELLSSGTTPDDRPISLSREAGQLVVRVDGTPMMTGRVHGSEALMAELACAPLANKAAPRVLVGGLGMGHTLRAALDLLPADASVVVVEWMPIVVQWHQEFLGDLAGRPLEDPRVTLEVSDLVPYLRRHAKPFDAILLDVDNGPDELTTKSNSRLYAVQGLEQQRRLLRPGGTFVLWSSFQRPSFVQRMKSAGFKTEVCDVRATGRSRKGAHHTLYVGRVRA